MFLKFLMIRTLYKNPMLSIVSITKNSYLLTIYIYKVINYCKLNSQIILKKL